MNVTAIFRPAPAIAHAREVERCDRTVIIEERRDKGPPPRMCPAAMKEQNSRQGSFRRTPAQEMNRTSFDVNACELGEAAADRKPMKLDVGQHPNR